MKQGLTHEQGAGSPLNSAFGWYAPQSSKSCKIYSLMLCIKGVLHPFNGRIRRSKRIISKLRPCLVSDSFL
ncbi:hypothetical protein HMPREF9554_00983 [Treponema phagedenis F0421]|nr:hypothetical protein HMPREF9554_00983 [Treponema phagedenis F0421]